MATDATGTPTSPDSIPTYNTAVDAPSGKGFNAAMAAIQTALSARVSKPAGLVSGETAIWNGASFVRSSVTGLTPSGIAGYPATVAKMLAGDGTWPGGVSLIWDSVDQSVSLPAASVSTPTLPTTFKHLLVFAELRTAAAAVTDTIGLRMSGVSTASYYWQSVTANAGVLGGSSTGGATQTSAAVGVVIGNTASLPGALSPIVMFLPNYNDANSYKHFISASMAVYGAASGNTPLYVLGGMENSYTTATTSLTLLSTGAANIAAGRISVYGLG